jgi:hypothetical protein
MWCRVAWYLSRLWGGIWSLHFRCRRRALKKGAASFSEILVHICQKTIHRNQESSNPPIYYPENFTVCLSTLLLSTCTKLFEVTLYTMYIVSVFPANTFKCLTVQYIRRRVTGCSECGAQFDPRPVHVGLIAYKVKVARVIAICLQQIRHIHPYAPDLRTIFEIVTLSLNETTRK